MIFAAGYTLVALILLLPVGNELCRHLLDFTQLKSADAQKDRGQARAGRVIGNLERLILAIGIIGQSWEVLAAVIALKTVARFSELDQKAFAEYFLVGSLFSVLWTILVTVGWLAFDARVGADLRGTVAGYLDAAPLPGQTPAP